MAKILLLALFGAASLAQSDLSSTYTGGPDEMTPSKVFATLPTNTAMCHTLLTCAGETGVTHTVTTITTTISDLRPTTPVTITPTTDGGNGITTVTVIKSTEIHEYVTSIVPPGGTISTERPSSGTPGAPGTVFIIPPGPPPTSVVTVTTSIPNFNPSTTCYFPGRPPATPNGPGTVVVVPPRDERPTDWSCSCITGPAATATTTVTVTSVASAVPTVTVTGGDGKPTATPASQFPCSDNDDAPCRGTVLAPWKKFDVFWNARWPKPGPPEPLVVPVNFADDSILTLTDDRYKVEHFEVSLDGKVIGETKELGFDKTKYCGLDPDACMSKGWSHAFFSVPKGPHTISLKWTKGDYTGWSSGGGQFRFEKTCSCPAT